jgi:hypothetical protein
MPTSTWIIFINFLIAGGCEDRFTGQIEGYFYEFFLDSFIRMADLKYYQSNYEYVNKFSLFHKKFWEENNFDLKHW